MLCIVFVNVESLLVGLELYSVYKLYEQVSLRKSIWRHQSRVYSAFFFAISFCLVLGWATPLHCSTYVHCCCFCSDEGIYEDVDDSDMVQPRKAIVKRPVSMDMLNYAESDDSQKTLPRLESKEGDSGFGSGSGGCPQPVKKPKLPKEKRQKPKTSSD